MFHAIFKIMAETVVSERNETLGLVTTRQVYVSKFTTLYKSEYTNTTIDRPEVYLTFSQLPHSPPSVLGPGT